MNLATIPKYVITLPEQPKRKERAISHFKESGLEGVTFFNGINAESFGLRTVHPYTLDDARDRPDNPGTFFMGTKPIGIWLSHRIVWDVINLSEHSHAMILEDDCAFRPGWRPVTEQAFKDVPEDFDFLYIGSCCAEKATRRHIKGLVWQVCYPICLHMYVVAKKAMPHVLATQRKVESPIDISLLMNSFPKLKVFAVLPSPVYQFDTELIP